MPSSATNPEMPPLFYQVDAFTAEPFAGNPAAVCILSTPREQEWMQTVAAEMNLSETAFLYAETNGTYRLRWFTPTNEVSLCGHATLASAHVLWSDGLLHREAPARFETESGRLTAQYTGDWIALDFPSDPVQPVDPPDRLLDGLGGPTPTDVARSSRDYLVRFANPEAVHDLTPDMEALARLEGARGVIATAATDAGSPHFISRFFAPKVGVPEDPVTGSSHCALGPYWAAKTGRTSLVGRQVSTRGGTVRIEIDAADADRLTLAGRAVTVVNGRLAV